MSENIKKENFDIKSLEKAQEVKDFVVTQSKKYRSQKQ
jgi:hypothetical protein